MISYSIPNYRAEGICVSKLLRGNVDYFCGYSGPDPAAILHFDTLPEDFLYLNELSDITPYPFIEQALLLLANLRPVELSVNKSEFKADGVDTCVIKVKATDPVSINIDGTVYPVTLVDGEAYISISAIDKKSIEIFIDNGELRNMQVIKVYAV